MFIYQHDGTAGHTNDGLYQYLTEGTTDAYVQIKDEFYVGTQFDFSYSYGQMETISDNNEDNFNFANYYNTIKAEVVGWFGTYVSGYSSVSAAITGEGGLSEEAAGALYAIYDNANWNTF